jgi:hypothetical protein
MLFGKCGHPKYNMITKRVIAKKTCRVKKLRTKWDRIQKTLKVNFFIY